ncbi:K(+)-transporting ATPase subunit F [Priestia abyssalis]
MMALFGVVTALTIYLLYVLINPEKF